MSHFVGLVFSEDLSVLDKYDENMEVDEYIAYTKKEAIAREKQDIKDSYDRVEARKKSGKELETWEKEILEKGFDITDYDAWEKAKRWGYKVSEDGKALLSTYNPDSKWDWYSIGGRWTGYLPYKEEPNEYYDEATIKDIDWKAFIDKHGAPFCFITDEGDWHQCAEMGWWGMTSNDKEEKEWNKEFKDYLETLNEDTPIIVVDFHI